MWTTLITFYFFDRGKIWYLKRRVLEEGPDNYIFDLMADVEAQMFHIMKIDHPNGQPIHWSRTRLFL